MIDNFTSFTSALAQNGLVAELLAQEPDRGPCLLAIKGNIICFHFIPRSHDEEERFSGYQPDNNQVHIWEDVWLQKPEVVLSRLKAALNLTEKRFHGRQTTAKRVEKELAMHFLEENHLQVALPGKYRYGLFYKDELLSLAVFSGARKMKLEGDIRSFELLRFCHANNMLVVGGLSKLLKAFSSDFAPDNIMTYIDKDWSQGRAFIKLGFKKVDEKPPQAFWVSPKEMVRYYPKRLPEHLNNIDNMLKAGYFSLYNSGSSKLIKTYG